MKKLSKLMVSGLLVMTMGLGVGCSNSTEKQEAVAPEQEEKVYVVGTNPTFPPFEMMSDDGKEIIGFDIDMINAIAEDQGIKVKVQSMEFDGLIMAVQSGGIDIIASGMTIKEDRKKEVDFTAEYINAGLAVAVAQGNDEIKAQEDLQGKVVAAQLGTTGADKCYQLKDEGIVKEVKVYNSVDLAFLELLNGGVDAVINDIPVTEAYMAQHPDKIKFAGDPLVSEGFGIAVKKGNAELLEKLDAGLANIKANGIYDEIHDKYFSEAE